jgi:hypothetical protein
MPFDVATTQVQAPIISFWSAPEVEGWLAAHIGTTARTAGLPQALSTRLSGHRPEAIVAVIYDVVLELHLTAEERQLVLDEVPSWLCQLMPPDWQIYTDDLWGSMRRRTKRQFHTYEAPLLLTFLLLGLMLAFTLAIVAAALDIVIRLIAEQCELRSPNEYSARHRRK